MASSCVMMCFFGIAHLFSLRLLIRYPGLWNVTLASNPIIPMLASYSAPGIEMYSVIPKDKLPALSKDDFFRLLSLDANSLLSSSSAFFPLSVTLVPIASPGLSFHVGILFLALVCTALIPEIASSSFWDFSSLAPGSPTPIFNVSFSMLISLISCPPLFQGLSPVKVLIFLLRMHMFLQFQKLPSQT